MELSSESMTKEQKWGFSGAHASRCVTQALVSKQCSHPHRGSHQWVPRVLLSTSCLVTFIQHGVPQHLVSAHSQAQRRCQVLRDASQQTLESPEDAPRTPVQVGEASRWVSPHGEHRVWVCQEHRWHAVFFGITVSAKAGAARGWDGRAPLPSWAACDGDPQPPPGCRWLMS